MGDTFVDSWQDQVPQRWHEFTLEDVENTKWEGNCYTYRHDLEERDPRGDDRARIKIWSRASDIIRLDCELWIALPGVEVHIRSFGGDWKAEEKMEFIPAVKWDNFEKALTDSKIKFEEVIEHAKAMSIIVLKDRWESKY